MLPRLLLCPLLFAALVAADEAPLPAEIGPAIAAFTGARTRCAWIDAGRLARLDSADGRLRLTDLAGPLRRPVISPSGKAVVLVDFTGFASWRIGWDDNAATPLVDGRVTCVRRGDDGREVMYWQTRDNAMVMAPLDAPAEATVVWTFPFPPREDKSNNWQVSADGQRAAATIPWPHNGTARLPQVPGRDFVELGLGCWPQIAPDNSYRVFHLHGGQHRHIAMYDATAERAWFVKLDPHPDPRRQGAETPRWANDPRFLTVVDRGYHSDPPSVFLGRFAEDFSRIDTWLRISTPGQMAEPVCWLADLPAYAPATVDPDHIARTDVVATWPTDLAGLQFLWRGWAQDQTIRDADGTVLRRCLVRPRGRTRPYRELAADLRGGWLEAEGLPADLHDALRQAPGLGIELLAAPFDLAGTGVLMAYGPPEDPNLLVSQEDRQLVCSLRGEDGQLIDHRFGPLPWRFDRLSRSLPDPLLLVLDLSEGHLTLYADGMPLAAVSAPGTSTWRPGPLVFGARADGNDDWSGQLEAVAIYARSLPATAVAEERARSTLRFTRRNPLKPRTCTGTLVDATPVPALEDITPYPRSLVVDTFDVADGDGGTTRIQVARWAWLDNVRVLEDRTPGRDYRLVLEPVDRHPLLDGERLDGLTEDVTMELFLDVAPLN